MANDIPINGDWLPNVLRDDHHLGHHHRLRLQKHGTPALAEAEGGTEDGRGLLAQFVGNAGDHQRGDAGTAEVAELLKVVRTLLLRQLQFLHHAIDYHLVGTV